MDEFKIFKNWLTKVSFLTEKDCSLFEPFLKTKQLKAKDYFLIEGNKLLLNELPQILSSKNQEIIDYLEAQYKHASNEKVQIKFHELLKTV
jgi:hypothetical protein